MGTASSIEMKIKDELDEGSDRRFIKKHTSQPLNVLPGARMKKSDGVKQSQSLYSLDVGGSPNLQLPVTKENELKLAKEQEFQALLNKNKKLDTENNRLRAELQALNKLCQKLRAERDTATDSCHDATRRAFALEQDREKIQRQFKMFREAKESEMQSLLQDKRSLEAKFHRMQAHGVATIDDHKFESNVQLAKEQPLIPDSPMPRNHWWGSGESDTTSLFGSYVQIRNAAVPESNGSLTELKNYDDNGFDLSDGDWKLSSSSYFENSGMLPSYTDPEYIDRNYLRIYISGTPDCREEITNILELSRLKALQNQYQKCGCFLSVFSLPDITFDGTASHQNHSIPADEIVKHAIEISDLVLFMIGQKSGRLTESEHLTLSDETVRKKTNVIYFISEGQSRRDSTLSRIVEEIRNSRQNFKVVKTQEEAVEASFVEIRRMTRLELDVDETSSSDEIDCVGDLLLDDDIELEQRAIASMVEGDQNALDFHEYYERLDDFVSSPGPTPPVLISGGIGSGKTSLIKSWVERLHTLQRNFLVFQHYVTSRESSTADPVMLMRRLLYQIAGHLPSYLVPPSFILSSYDSNHLRVSLPKWLDRLSTMNNRQIILVFDSVDLIYDANKHFKWLLDPLPVGVRVVISVGVNGCPPAWTQWPTIRLNPLSTKSVQRILSQTFQLKVAAPCRSWETEISTHCKHADTCCPLYLSQLKNVLCSAISCDAKNSLLQRCLRTHNCTELYHVLLRYIEEECIDTQFRKNFRLILELILFTREGVNENLITNILPEHAWELWMHARIVLIQFGIIVERAGLIQFPNSLISSILSEMLINKKVAKTCTSMLIKAATQISSPNYRTTASLLPWLLLKAERKSDLCECLLQPHIFNNLYIRGRAGEIIQYWQYVGEDKIGIIEQYKGLLSSLSDPSSDRNEGNGSLFSKPGTSLNALMIANVYESVGRFLRDLCIMDTAATCTERAMEIRERELDPDHHLVANSLHYQGTIYTKWKKYAMAEPLFRHSLELIESIIGREHPRIIQELQSLTFVLRKLERHEEADLIAKRISSLQEKNGGRLLSMVRFWRLKRRTALIEELASEEESVSMASIMNDLGILFYMQKNYSSAETFLKKSLNMRIKLLGNSDANVAQCLHNLSAIYNEQELYRKAMECMKDAFNIRQEIYGKHNPLVLSTARRLAILCKKSQQFESARFLYRKVLEMSKEMHGCDSLPAATSMVNLAVLECHLGNREAALPLYEAALEIYETRRGPTSIEVAATLRNIAILRYDGEDFQEAAALYRRSMCIKEELAPKVMKPSH